MTLRDIWWRSVYAVIIVVFGYLLLITLVAPRWASALTTRLTGPLGPQAAALAVVALFTLFPVLLAVGVLTGVDRYVRAKRDGELETRCRKCQHILRGLTEPRCPECGERI